MFIYVCKIPYYNFVRRNNGGESDCHFYNGR